MIGLNILNDSDLCWVKIFGIKHCIINLSPKKSCKKILWTKMHVVENTNNLEILKLKIWCEKNDISLVLYGNINQLPLFSIFADQLILADHYNLKSIYEGHSNYSSTITMGFIDLNRYPKLAHRGYRPNLIARNPWPYLLQNAWDSVTIDEVIARFRDIDIYVLQSSLRLYEELAEKYPESALLTEVKQCHNKGNKRQWLNEFRDISQAYSEIKDQLKLNLKNDILEMEFRKQLLLESNKNYMSIQLLFSLFKNWMWLCYGGSSNIFSFLPVKAIGLYDAFLCEDVIRALSVARIGEIGKIFPIMDIDIFLKPSKFVDHIHTFRDTKIHFKINKAKTNSNLEFLNSNEHLKPFLVRL